jgi:BCD family chlorophyll transporter-like MFS transporter
MTRAERAAPRPRFAAAWADLTRGGTAGRLLAVVAVGTFAFNMQDVLLEPYGGEILRLSVAATTLLSAMTAVGALLAFLLSARWLGGRRDPVRMAARGLLTGIAAFTAVVFAAPTATPALFYAGAFGIGFGGGLFAVSTLAAAMALPATGLAGRGLALGAWGAAQATASGLAIACGGALRDVIGHLAMAGSLGQPLATPATGYTFVYHAEIGLLFVTLIVLGPLVRTQLWKPDEAQGPQTAGILDFPT